ncbi:MAG: hypothetical protein ACR2ML_07900 [Solirubrobacteraceae bacterium]
MRPTALLALLALLLAAAVPTALAGVGLLLCGAGLRLLRAKE